MENSIEIRVLRPGDATAAADVLVRAFDEEPSKLIMLPDARLRRTIFEMSVKPRLYDALRDGRVHGALVNGELGAVALWYPPGVRMLSVRGSVRMVLTLVTNVTTVVRALPSIVRTLAMDLRGFVDLIRNRRPAVSQASRGLTWRLDLLGTVPEHRGKGLARALLERQLHRCDEDGAAVWLEATDPTNPPIYERFGFKTIAHIDGPKWLPGYWVMRREPKTVQQSRPWRSPTTNEDSPQRP